MGEDCERLMQIASAKDPEQALLDERQRVRLAVAAPRARKKAEADVTNIEGDGVLRALCG